MLPIFCSSFSCPKEVTTSLMAGMERVKKIKRRERRVGAEKREVGV